MTGKMVSRAEILALLLINFLTFLFVGSAYVKGEMTATKDFSFHGTEAITEPTFVNSTVLETNLVVKTSNSSVNITSPVDSTTISPKSEISYWAVFRECFLVSCRRSCSKEYPDDISKAKQCVPGCRNFKSIFCQLVIGSSVGESVSIIRRLCPFPRHPSENIEAYEVMCFRPKRLNPSY